MNNEQIAESVLSKLALSAAWANLERLRLIDVEFEENLGDLNEAILRIAADKKEIKARRFENFKLILAVSQQIDELQDAPEPVVEGKKPRVKKEKVADIVSPPAEKFPCWNHYQNLKAIDEANDVPF